MPRNISKLKLRNDNNIHNKSNELLQRTNVPWNIIGKHPCARKGHCAKTWTNSRYFDWIVEKCHSSNLFFCKLVRAYYGHIHFSLVTHANIFSRKRNSHLRNWLICSKHIFKVFQHRINLILWFHYLKPHDHPTCYSNNPTITFLSYGCLIEFVRLVFIVNGVCSLRVISFSLPWLDNWQMKMVMKSA